MLQQPLRLESSTLPLSHYAPLIQCITCISFNVWTCLKGSDLQSNTYFSFLVSIVHVNTLSVFKLSPPKPNGRRHQITRHSHFPTEEIVLWKLSVPDKYAFFLILSMLVRLLSSAVSNGVARTLIKLCTGRLLDLEEIALLFKNRNFS